MEVALKESMEGVVLDERAFTDERGWHMVKVRLYWEKKIYDKIFQGKPDDYEVTPAEFLMTLGIDLPEKVRVLRFGQYKGSDTAYYGYVEVA